MSKVFTVDIYCKNNKLLHVESRPPTVGEYYEIRHGKDRSYSNMEIKILRPQDYDKLFGPDKYVGHLKVVRIVDLTITPNYIQLPEKTEMGAENQTAEKSTMYLVEIPHTYFKTSDTKIYVVGAYAISWNQNGSDNWGHIFEVSDYYKKYHSAYQVHFYEEDLPQWPEKLGIVFSKLLRSDTSSIKMVTMININGREIRKWSLKPDGSFKYWDLKTQLRRDRYKAGYEFDDSDTWDALTDGQYGDYDGQDIGNWMDSHGY